MILLCPPEKCTHFHYPLDPKKIRAEGSLISTKTPLTGGVTGKTFTDTEKNKTEKFYPFSNWDCRIRQPSKNPLKYVGKTLKIRACSHYAKFCLFCKKICQRETILSANVFFRPRKFCQASPNFKETVE